MTSTSHGRALERIPFEGRSHSLVVFREDFLDQDQSDHFELLQCLHITSAIVRDYFSCFYNLLLTHLFLTDEHGHCLKWVVAAAAVGYGLYMTLKWKRKHVNASIKKDCDKVVDTVEIEDLGDKTAFCRCWKSSKFPLCDGSHNKHNKDTGDNLGPLCVKRREWSVTTSKCSWSPRGWFRFEIAIANLAIFWMRQIYLQQNTL